MEKWVVAAKRADFNSIGQEFEIEVTAAGYENNYKFTYTAESQYKYVYAGLSWAEYWENEGVYAAGDASSSDDVDTKGHH